MKLHFEPNLAHQTDAITAVVDLFRGQESDSLRFTVTRRADLPGMEDDLGVGNPRLLRDDELLANLRPIQLRHGLNPDEEIKSRDFTVEMETGTGKTYVYLRTIFELHKTYGFTKFIIVVPSVAIREGVATSLRLMDAHFRGLYDNTPYAHFVYDSQKLGQVRDFATSPHIRIMIATIGALNKADINTIHKENEKTGGEKPIDLIKATRPIVIVDEPQKVDGGDKGKGREALAAMAPLCTLRYSATHRDAHHPVFKLDAVEAYERKLVKQIEVASATVESAHNRPYVKLLEVKSTKAQGIFARIEIDDGSGKSVRTRTATVRDGDDLWQESGLRDIYKDHTIGELRATKGAQHLELKYPGGEVFLKAGEVYGGVNPDELARHMIRRTIREHFDKELRLNPKGIKVLSLFFLKSVEKYRRYDAEGEPIKGDYARLFEEEYARLSKHPDYRTLFKEIDFSHPPEAVHAGYFSIDRKKVGAKTVEQFRDSSEDRPVKADDDTFDLIMRDKERLLDLKEPVRFIFSHSALREGWDNPNVFQICSLREMSSETERRQTLGRGLRLAVDAEGRRTQGFEINTLTVVANESYEEFADNLQKEIRNETGLEFGVIGKSDFAAVATGTKDAEGKDILLGRAASETLQTHLIAQGYLDAKGKVLDALRNALRNGTLILPPEYEPMRAAITLLLRRQAGRLEVKNADEKKKLTLRKAYFDLATDSDDAKEKQARFKALWERIRQKTTYRLAFDNAKMLTACADSLRRAPTISRSHLHWQKTIIATERSGLSPKDPRAVGTSRLDEGLLPLPDILGILENRTGLTRRSLLQILNDSGRLGDFPVNPQEFIDHAAKAIIGAKRSAIVEGIRYTRLGSTEIYAQELFQHDELAGHFKHLVQSSDRTVFEEVPCQSDVELNFVKELEADSAVKFYLKLPSWFRVPTPLGDYIPDWAVLADTDEGERLYFVVETKDGLFDDDLRDKESAKITCGEAHFKALAVDNDDAPARYRKAKSWSKVLASR